MKWFVALLLCFVSAFAHATSTDTRAARLAMLDITISSGGTTSSALNLNGLSLVGITFPTSFTSTSVSFTGSTAIGGTYRAVYDTSGAISYTIAQNRYYSLDPVKFQGLKYLKIVTGSAEAYERTVTLHLKGTL